MVTTWQAILIGVAVAYAPVILLIAVIYFRDGAFSRPRPEPPKNISDHLENIAADLIAFAPRVHDVLETPAALTARLRLLQACRVVLIEVGFTVEMYREARLIDDDDGNGNAPLAP
jgi:hypothetical protein